MRSLIAPLALALAFVGFAAWADDTADLDRAMVVCRHQPPMPVSAAVLRSKSDGWRAAAKLGRMTR